MMLEEASTYSKKVYVSMRSVLFPLIYLLSIRQTGLQTHFGSSQFSRRRHVFFSQDFYLC